MERAAGKNELWSTDRERSKTFWLGIYGALLEETGLPADQGLDVKLYEAFSDHANYSLFPDVERVLEKLGSSGLILGVISNFEEWLEVLLEHLDIARYFSVTAISGIEGVEKPDPSLFRIALSRGGVDAGDAIYVGDNPRFDVDPAAAVGMHAVLLDRRGRFQGVDTPRISSLEELPAMAGI
ncbi:MAG: HAD-IA family hydrolase [Actinomycetota bacterium]